jgi:hypothetical protein
MSKLVDPLTVGLVILRAFTEGDHQLRSDSWPCHYLTCNERGESLKADSVGGRNTHTAPANGAAVVHCFFGHSWDGDIAVAATSTQRPRVRLLHVPSWLLGR